MNGASGEPLRFRIEPTEQDWIAANWLILRHRWLWRRLVLSFGAVWLFYGALIVGLNTREYGWSTEWALRNLADAAVYAAVAGAILIGLSIGLLPRRVSKQLADLRRLSAGADVEVSTEGVRFNTGIATADLAWNQFKRWHENARVLALAITERELLLLPKSQVDPGEIDAVRSHLIAANVERGLT